MVVGGFSRMQVGPHPLFPAGLLPQSTDCIDSAVPPCRDDDRSSFSLVALSTVEQKGGFRNFHPPN